MSIFRSNRNANRIRGKLAILVPTYRFDAQAKHTLSATASLATEDFSVVIADNSGSAEKLSFLRKLEGLHSNIHIYQHAKDIGAFGNWRFLFDQTALKYCLFVGDDDVCTPAYVESAYDLLEQHADASAAAGSFAMIDSANRMQSANRGRFEAAADERCINFRIGGGNSLPNSMARRAALEPFMDYILGHPLRASFFDWMMAYTLLGAGKYLTTEEGCYLYDVSNWDSSEACWRNDAKFYVAAGLPASFTAFHDLYWAVETAHFFCGTYSPVVDTQQRITCARVLYANRLEAFRYAYGNAARRVLLEQQIAHHDGAVAALGRLVANDDALRVEVFDWFSTVLGAFDPSCALAYLDYVRSSLARERSLRVDER